MAETGYWVRGATAAVLAVAMAGAAMAQDDIRMVEGSLTYLERVALPPDALAVVEARDARGRLLGEATLGSRGAQVPLGFAIGLPADIDATLRAAIILDGRPRWYATDIAIPAGTGSVALGEIVLSRFVPMGFASTLRCGDRELRIGFFEANAVIEVDGTRQVLIPVPAASGARFEAADDPGTWVWSRGGGVAVALDGETLPPCAAIPPEAPRPYAAQGPGWSLAIADGVLRLVEEGQDPVEAALPEARFDGGFVYDLPAAGLTLRMVRGLCRDAAGLPHPETVEVARDGRVLSGCGGDPLDLVTGAEWVAEDIGGRGIPDGARVTLAFAEGGGLSGVAACNRYATQVRVAEGGLAVGAIAATRMGCPEALMTTEGEVFAALAAIRRFDIDPSGALLLYGEGSVPLLTARR